MRLFIPFLSPAFLRLFSSFHRSPLLRLFIPFQFRDTDGSFISSVSCKEKGQTRSKTVHDTDQVAHTSVSRSRQWHKERPRLVPPAYDNDMTQQCSVKVQRKSAAQKCSAKVQRKSAAQQCSATVHRNSETTGQQGTTWQQSGEINVSLSFGEHSDDERQ